MTSHKFVEVVTTAIAKEPSDAIFERQFDFVSTAINTYTPEKFRPELNSKMFDFIYKLLPELPKDNQNRITILKGKLVNFAKTDEQKLTLLRWKRKEEKHLEEFEMSVGQKWSTVVKAFTVKSLSLEEKENIFAEQEKEDPSDTAKKYRCTCDSLKSSEEEFEKIYESFKSKDNTRSVSSKQSIASGWNHPYHKERLLKYRERYFKDVQELINVLDGDHFEVFYESLAPFDDDLEYQIAEYEKIKFPEGKDKNSRDILKMIDNLKRRQKAYQLYTNPSL